jgi:ATP-dependent helicase/nuclease subunit A
MRAAARPGGDVQAGSLLKALELLRSSQADLWSSAELVDYFDRLVSQDEAHDAISARADRRSAVRVMNLHKVKGLEAPVVFLADPTGSSEHAPLARIDRSGDTVRGYLAVTGTERGSPRTVLLAQPQYWEAHAAAERQFQHAEELRLLYVAATRAGCGLTVSMRQFQPSRNPWNFFDTALKHKPELTESGGSPPLTIEKGSVTEQERRDVLEQIRTRWMEASQRTYDVRAVKATVVQHGRFIVSHGEYGTEWGSAIHLLLQAAMLDPNADIRALAEAALTDMDLSLILTEAAVETVQSVIRSDVWKRARAAQKRLVEVPFQRLVCGEGQDTALSTIIRGVIDLAFKEPDGWVIVDYKSDRVSDARIGELVELYSPQVMSYAQAWPEIIGEPVCEAGLYFTHVNRYIPVQSDCKKK